MSKTYQIKQITNFLETQAPLNYQESYDNAGLITGFHNQLVNSVLIALDATEAVVHEAVQKGCQMVIAHHPIVFGGLKKINGYNYVEKAIIMAIKHDIALYAIHTNLDNVLNGVNQTIASRLGLKDVQILHAKNPQKPDVGSGMIGFLPQAINFEQFMSLLAQQMELQVCRYALGSSHLIEKVAICGGAGSFLIKEALRQQAQAFVTADLKYHEYFEGQDELLLIDIGHYESEKYTQDLLLDWLSKHFEGLSVQKTSVNTNPAKWYLA
ncbi:MAG: Nif3-like dinuclear metal center hexameric protein [Cytophagales bacterium]|nr:MAG: Nif3-like dinuclear metal center hexameric protein [Cytophagales bacterium]TAF62259.1 MAG: Nif3-like dinuclear metal center hexameric protein [Cytophagales bacterium]